MSDDTPPPTAVPSASYVPATSTPDVPLQFIGGTVGALAPFAVFLGGVTTLAALGAPEERGFWPMLVAALMVGLLLSRDRSRYAEAMIDGMSQRMVAIMICAWLFAGMLGTLLSASGFVGTLAWLAQAAQLTGGGYIAAAFLACTLVATATGTSFGTILVAGPLLYPAGGAAGAEPAVLMGAILAGATVGDSISPVSDTTIASSGTQDADIGTTVRRRLRYVIPAATLALIGSTVLGTVRGSAAAIAPVAPNDITPRALAMVAIPLVVLVLLLRRRHLVEALLVGVLSAALLALALGLVAPRALLYVEDGSFGASGLLIDGMQRSVGVSIFTLLLMGLVGTIQATDLLPRLVAAAERHARTARSTEWWIVGAVSGAVLLTTHSVVAVLMTGPFAKASGARAGLSRYRRANLLDLTVCIWPFLLPWFLPPILAAGATQQSAAFGMPVLSPAIIGVHNTYAWALLLMVPLAVVTGYGRHHRTDETA